MDISSIIVLSAIALVGLASLVIGSLGVRIARSTSDFLTASRTVGATAGAAAISGEYLSVATFLGVAGLVLREGVDGLWLPVAFCAGYLGVLLFVAAPLRRSGVYTISDFAEARLRDLRLRKICTFIGLFIGWLYLLPQLQGAGLSLTTLTDLPSWMGVLIAGLLVVTAVVAGGMRSITFVQAFQYWLKVTALAVPVLIGLALFVGDQARFDRPAAPDFTGETTIDVRTDVVLQVLKPTPVTVDGVVDGVRLDGPTTWEPREHSVSEGAELVFPTGAAVPIPVGMPAANSEWLTPATTAEPARLFEIYSVLLAGALGAMGLPHVVGRFYTKPDGRAARRATVVVLAMIGGVFILVTVLGVLSRVYTPQLLVNGNTDGAVLLVPTGMFGSGWAGWLLGGLVAAGAAAAFLSTSSGLVVSIAGVLFTDVLGGRGKDFRLAAVISAVIPAVLAMVVPRLDFAITIPLVFATAASTFSPLLILGVWWRGLTAAGATAGLLVGGALAGTAVVGSLAWGPHDSMLGTLLLHPAMVSVPAAFLTMIVVSKLTARSLPANPEHRLLSMHAPERLGVTALRLERKTSRRP